jgi:hypothetical protein
MDSDSDWQKTLGRFSIVTNQPQKIEINRDEPKYSRNQPVIIHGLLFGLTKNKANSLFP